MFRRVTHSALRLDVWLRTRLGRPYTILLSVGLVIEIVRGVTELPEHLSARPRAIGRLLTLVLEAALLLHQVGALSHIHGPLGPHGHGEPEGGQLSLSPQENRDASLAGGSAPGALSEGGEMERTMSPEGIGSSARG